MVQESAAPVKERSSTSDGESGRECQNAFLSQADRLGKAGAAIVTIPKAEKDVDDFDVRSATHCIYGLDEVHHDTEQPIVCLSTA